MKLNRTRYSSQVGEVWVNFMFKIKYCHKIFDDNHIHLVLNLGIKSKPEIAKKLKGFIAKKFFLI